MKKLYLLFFCAILGGVLSSAKAQTSINIVQMGDSLGSTYCHGNSAVYYWSTVQLAGYSTNDSVEYTLNWGDGTIETDYFPIYGTSPQNSWGFWQYVYALPGTYYPQLIVTAPDNKKDTLIGDPIVIEICGNISGKAYVDVDNSCTFNVGDSPLSSALIVITDASSSNVFYAATDAVGDYEVKVPLSGSYSINITSPYFSTACPAGGHTGVTAPSSGKNLGIQCGTGFDLLSQVHGAGFRPGVSTSFAVRPINATCTPVSGTISVIMSDPLITYTPASWGTPPIVNGDTLTWNFTNIDYNSALYSWNWSNFAFRALTDTTANIGDTICIEVIVNPITGDNNPANNTITYCFPVSNSFDPNMKTALPVGQGPEHIIAPGTGIDYTIHFQNTGTAEAFDIFILDTMDVDLDFSTFVITGASHKMDWQVYEDNVVRFIFSDINLPDSNTNEPASHGYVSYHIEHVAGAPLGTVIENRAGIYFDYNEPIITNTTSHKLGVVSGPIGIETYGSKDNIAYIFPNPASGSINVSLKKDGRGIATMKTLTGQSVSTYSLSEGLNTLDISALSPGLYLMEVNVNNQLQVSRVIVQ